MNELIKVLAVEDDNADALILDRLLQESVSVKFQSTHIKNLKESIKLLSEQDFDIILLDLSLPDSQGFDTFSSLYLSSLSVPIVILTGLDDEKTAIKSVQNGAQDYLVKGKIDSKRLITSIVFSIERHKKEIADLYKDKKDCQEKLTEHKITQRQKEILSFIGEGMSNEAISKKLNLSISTIRNHIARIFKKLNISNRAQAATIASKAGLEDSNQSK